MRQLPACRTLIEVKTDTKHIPIFGVSFPPFAKQWPRTKCLPIEIPLDKWVDYAVTTKDGFGVPVWGNKVLIDNIEVHEVTVGRNKQFLAETGYRQPPWHDVNWFSPTNDHPMIFVDVNDTVAY